MFLNANLLTEVCSLVICVFLIYTNSKKNESSSSQYVYFIRISYSLFINITLNLCRHFFENIFLIYIFNMLFDISSIFVNLYLILYCLYLTPLDKIQINAYRNLFIKIYIVLSIFVLSSPLTKLVYYVEYENIEKGPFAFISFFIGYIGFVFMFIISLKKNNISRKIKRDVFLIYICIFISNVVEFLYPNLILNGFGYVCALLVIYETFHNNSYDMVFGVSKDEFLFKKFNHLKYTSQNFSLILLDFLNLDVFNYDFLIGDIRLHIADIFRNCEKQKFDLEIFSWNDRFIILIDNPSNIEDFISFLTNEILNSKLNNETNRIEYKIVCISTPNMIDNIKEIDNLDKFEEDVHYLTSKELEIFDEKIRIVRELNNLFITNNLDDPRVEIFYQPILDIQSGKFLSAEALTRLNLRYFDKLIFPNTFIPILEEKNYIHKYSLIVLNKVCVFIKKLEEENIDIDGISINFSLKEFMETNFEKDLIEIVSKNDVSPSKIHIEVTESIEAEDFNLLKSKIENLKNFGFKFYLDDFGTGYSNLSKIIEFPFDVIKFDKSLIDESIKNEDAKDITFGMSDLLSKKFEILFEGIENEDYESFAKKTCARYFQGYKYSRPIRDKDVIKLLGKSNKRG